MGLSNPTTSLAKVVWLTSKLIDAILHTTLNTQEKQMKLFIAGTIFGLVLATVGFSGIARILDHGVDKVKTQSVEMAK